MQVHLIIELWVLILSGRLRIVDLSNNWILFGFFTYTYRKARHWKIDTAEGDRNGHGVVCRSTSTGRHNRNNWKREETGNQNRLYEENDKCRFALASAVRCAGTYDGKDCTELRVHSLTIFGPSKWIIRNWTVIINLK